MAKKKTEKKVTEKAPVKKPDVKKVEAKKKVLAAIAAPKPKYTLSELSPSEVLKSEVGCCFKCRHWKEHAMNKGMGLCKLSNPQVGLLRTKANMTCNECTK